MPDSSDGNIGSLRIVGSRIAALDVDPQPEDLIVDLAGDRLLPGLINAHDHLQLNSLPALSRRGRYPARARLDFRDRFAAAQPIRNSRPASRCRATNGCWSAASRIC